MDATDWRSQYQRTTSDAGWWIAERTQLELTGADRLRFLQNYCTADVLGLASGAGCEAFITSVQGKTLGHGFIWSEGDGLAWDSEPGDGPRLLAHLDRYLLRDDVQLVDVHERGDRQVWLAGPRAAERLVELGLPIPPDEVSSSPATEARTDTAGDAAVVLGQVDGQPCKVRRLPIWRVPCLAVVLPDQAAAGKLADRLAAAGLPELAEPAREALRIEAGYPRYGMDITADNLPQEVGRDRQAISFTKGCYLGQETIARIDALGHVNRLLVGLVFEPAVSVQPGLELQRDARRVGHVTSVADSPLLATRVGLGYIRRELAEPGTVVKSSAGSVRVERMPLRSPA